MGASGNGIVRIGESEKILFMLILQQKFLTIDLILRWLTPQDTRLSSERRPKLYFKLNRLIKAGYLKKQKIDGYHVYLLTQTGLDVVRDVNINDIPLTSVSELDTIRHDLLAAEIRHYLESHGALNWVSDRELQIHADKIPYVPDGACTFGSRTVFVEVELTQKSKDRYERIAEAYTAAKGPDRVLYFHQNDSVIDYLKSLTAGCDRLGFFPYENGMDPPCAISGICASKEMSLGTFLGIS